MITYISYHGALAGLILVVNLLLCSFVQFAPQGFDLPCADCSLQGAVEAAVIQRIKLQLSAEDAKRLKSPFASGSLHKVLEKHAGLPQVLILRLAHLVGWQALELRFFLFTSPERCCRKRHVKPPLAGSDGNNKTENQIITALLTCWF